MDLVVTTPGVSTTTVRSALESEPREQLLVIDRSTRCGSTTVDPTTAVRLRVAVAPCAVSLHAADRFCKRFSGGHPVDGVICCQRRRVSTPKTRLEARFDCPVSVHTALE